MRLLEGEKAFLKYNEYTHSFHSNNYPSNIFRVSKAIYLIGHKGFDDNHLLSDRIYNFLFLTDIHTHHNLKNA